MDIHFKNALVTGGAGFIGSHIVDALLDRGCAVTVLDNLSTGNLSNLEHVKDQITFYKGDIRDPEVLTKAVKGCEVIFHQAAVVSVPQSVEDPVESAMVNDMGTLLVLETARKNNVKRVVLASSCAVYGDDPELPKRETMNPKPFSPYAVQKLTGEFHAHGAYGKQLIDWLNKYTFVAEQNFKNKDHAREGESFPTRGASLWHHNLDGILHCRSCFG